MISTTMMTLTIFGTILRTRSIRLWGERFYTIVAA
jgi:hypothetical protein